MNIKGEVQIAGNGFHNLVRVDNGFYLFFTYQVLPATVGIAVYSVGDRGEVEGGCSENKQFEESYKLIYIKKASVIFKKSQYK